MTWIEVASDAVKIGLGAVIGLASALMTTYISNRNKKDESFTDRKRNLLEHVMPIYEVLSLDAMEEAVAAMKGFDHGEEEPEKAIDVDIGIYDFESSKDLILRMTRQFNELESKVSLLGLTDLANMIDTQRSVFHSICTSNKTTWSSLFQKVKELEELRYQIFREFATSYKNA